MMMHPSSESSTVFPSITAPRNGAWVQPHIIGDSVGQAVIRNACSPPETWFLITLVPKWLPARTKGLERRPPRMSIRLAWKYLGDETRGNGDRFGPRWDRRIDNVGVGIDHLHNPPPLAGGGAVQERDHFTGPS